MQDKITVLNTHKSQMYSDNNKSVTPSLDFICTSEYIVRLANIKTTTAFCLEFSSDSDKIGIGVEKEPN